jgi:serine/threonine protein kinase
MDAEQTQKSANRRQQAIAQLIARLNSAGADDPSFDEAALIAAHPELMPELQAALRELKRQRDMQRLRAGETANVNLSTVLPTGDTSQTKLTESPDRSNIRINGYTLQRELGRGGQAVVFLAIQQNTGRKVAIKVIRREALADDRAIARFKREVQVLAALDHPNIVGILDTGLTTDGSHYIAMSYIAGNSLDEVMAASQHADSHDPARLLRLFLKICAAVNVAHVRGIVHRDLKPANIRVDERGEPHILDFGLASTSLDRLAGGDQPVAVTGEFLGSLPWCSPEQAEGDPDRIDMRTDVYSLGVILYQILTDGKFPYEVVGNMRDVLNNILNAEPMPPSKVVGAGAVKKGSREVRPGRLGPSQVNETMERIVLKALAKNREQRYQSAGELGRVVAHYLSGQQSADAVEPRPAAAAPAAKPAERARTRSLAMILLAVIVLCAVGTTVGIFMKNRGKSQDSVVAAPAAGDSTASPPTPAPAVIAPTPSVATAIPATQIVSTVKNSDFFIAGGTCHMEGDVLALTPAGIQCTFSFWPTNWTNYDLSFDAMSNSHEIGRGYHATVHLLDANVLNVWLSDFDNTAVDINTRYNTVLKRLQTKALRMEPDRWYQIRVQVRASEVKLFVDDVEYLSARDDRYTHGRAGISTQSPETRFRHIKVTAPDGAIMWQGIPDLSQLGANQLDLSRNPAAIDSNKTDLLKNLDLTANVLGGSWKPAAVAPTDHASSLPMTWSLAASGAGAQIQFPMALPPEYDFRATVIRATGNGALAMIAAENGNPFAWVIGGHAGTVSGFGVINGKDYDANDTTHRAGGWLSNGVEHTLVLRVRKDSIIAYIDGLPQLTLDTNLTGLSLSPNFKKSAAPLCGNRISYNRISYNRISRNRISRNRISCG